MDKRYQVFVSSTYADLKAERQRVIQALMEMDCIPAGMELFPAMDEAQWDFIKRVIDDCDYYLIVIGGRYGTVTSDGISYTEKEFDYANAKGIKIVALIHEDPDAIAVNKSDIDPEIRHKLSNFRDKVATNRLVKYWKSAEELPGLVVLSLAKTIKTYPAIGWVRSTSVPSNDMLQEINLLRKENAALRIRLESAQSKEEPHIEELADFDEKFEVDGTAHTYGSHSGGPHSWKASMSWRQLFALLAPYLVSHPEDSAVKETLAKAIADVSSVYGDKITIDDQKFRTISIQLKALGLVSVDYSKTVQGGMALFWCLTSKGENIMMQERTVKKVH